LAYERRTDKRGNDGNLMKEGSQEVEKSFGNEQEMLNIMGCWQEEIGGRELENCKRNDEANHKGEGG